MQSTEDRPRMQEGELKAEDVQQLRQTALPTTPADCAVTGPGQREFHASQLHQTALSATPTGSAVSGPGQRAFRNGCTPGPGGSQVRLRVETVLRMERVVGGDPVVEEQVLRFIAERYGARSLVYLPAHVAAAVLKRPGDFIRAAKLYCQPELAI